jgi:chromosome segregation ATPase
LTSLFFICWLADALASANARIASLEAKLTASQKAYDSATKAKANAEKLHKAAVAKAKKVESALSDASKERLQREQVMAEQLNKISAAAGGTHLSCTLFLLVLLFFILH